LHDVIQNQDLFCLSTNSGGSARSLQFQAANWWFAPSVCGASSLRLNTQSFPLKTLSWPSKNLRHQFVSSCSENGHLFYPSTFLSSNLVYIVLILH